MEPVVLIEYRDERFARLAVEWFGRIREKLGPGSTWILRPADVEDREHALNLTRRCRLVIILIGPEWPWNDGIRGLDGARSVAEFLVVTGLASEPHVIPVLLRGLELPLPAWLDTRAKPVEIDLEDRASTDAVWRELRREVVRLGEDGGVFLQYERSRPVTAPPEYELASILAHDLGVSRFRVGVLTPLLYGKREPAATCEPVLLGVTAPPGSTSGARFNAVFAAYIESARAAVESKLGRMGGPGTVPLLDVPPDRASGWTRGAPVIVRLTASQADVTPAERAFEWNGSQNLASFVVEVHADATGTLDLCFHVALGGVPIACIPLPVALGPPTAEATRTRTIRTADSAFASYASKDAQAVGHCLSALSRWSPGLEIFQDCLDLHPGESFKPQLSAEIAGHEVFLLFWSRHASASPWVRWEYDTARTAKGLDAVLPMPLEDPALAPPPDEFVDAHMRDRFMIARYALARIADEKARSTGP